MEMPLPTADQLWLSDNQSQSSGDGSGENAGPSPPFTEDPNWLATASTTPFQTGQLSPVSTTMDTAMDGLAVGPPMPPPPSTVSSCPDSRRLDLTDRGVGELDNGASYAPDDKDHPSRPECGEDEVNSRLQVGPNTPMRNPNDPDVSQNAVKQKRPRGRPRKHPITPAAASNKVTKGRSKTGCITCRKRKKKCDEARPRCMNCEKNAVVCEGYHEKQLWKSGKERAEEERMRVDSLPMITMQPIFHGVETAEDKVFWKHYINHFSSVLTVEGEARNAFKDILLQLANEHQGLMHSILAVSSKHIDWNTPYGAKLLQENPETTRESLLERSDYHHDEGMKRLYEDMARALPKDDPEYQTVLCARYGQMLCLLLQTRAEGNPRGEHRLHLQAYQPLIQQSPPEDPAFLTFITEFFQYHIFAEDLFWHPKRHDRLASEDWVPSMPLYPPRLLGVADGLLTYLPHITSIRNTVRANMAAGTEPTVDYTTLYKAAEIDAAIRQWMPQWPPGDNRDRVSLLYKQMMWVYLFRTIYPPNASSYRRSTVSTFRMASGGSNPSVMPGMPPRRASMLATVGGALAAQDSRHPSSCPPTRHPSRQNSMHGVSPAEQTLPPQRPGVVPPSASAPASPRPPSQQDRRITLAVEESLQLLESFKPSDPVQTLLLIPSVLIGTACFEVAQQQRLRAAVKTVRGYTGLRNCDRLLELLEEVWSLMAQEDWAAAWDWQVVAGRMGLDFACA